MTVEELKFFFRNPSLYKLRKKGFNSHFYETLIGDFYQELNIETIFDIGSNTGQSIITFHKAFPKAKIHAFEPLPDCYRVLAKNINGINNIILHNVAIGDEIGNIVFEENEYSASSSILPMTDEHIKNFPFTKNRKQTKVKVETLDNIFKADKDIKKLLVKIDVQGYEKQVLLGGKTVINQAEILIVETSFESLYKDQCLFYDIYKLLESMNFKYIGAFDQLISPKSNKILQQDAIFIKNK